MSGDRSRVPPEQPERSCCPGGADGPARRPRHIRSDNGSEFAVIAVREWSAEVGAKTLFIEPGSPWGETRVQLIRGINCRVEWLQ